MEWQCKCPRNQSMGIRITNDAYLKFYEETAFLLSLLLSLQLSARDKIKVACVGNSVTFGYNLPDRATQAYPVRLQQMLGERYEVKNFGHSGATLLNNGHNPYTRLPEFKDAVRYKADWW